MVSVVKMKAHFQMHGGINTLHDLSKATLPARACFSLPSFPTYHVNPAAVNLSPSFVPGRTISSNPGRSPVPDLLTR